jgi:3',5'-nucleoside bisphosphate phosphatase
MINADLHCHSTVSDGLLSPQAVAQRACDGGVTLWALTDHDEISGQQAAREAAEALGMRYVGGVEISVTWASRTVHIVGLNVAPTCTALIEGLARTRHGRIGRAQEIGRQLALAGVPGAYEGALKYVGNPDLISRTHFARHMVDSGLAKSVSDVFARYLAEGKPGYVPHRWAALPDALNWIKAAGGTPVIAHPGRYKYTPVEFAALFDEFKSLGGNAIEVVTGSHAPDQFREYAEVARHYGFRASRGSDFHDPAEPYTVLGGLPQLPPDLTPVWHDWL